MLCCMSVSQNTGRKVKAGRLRLPSQPGLHKEKLSQTEGGGRLYEKEEKGRGEGKRERKRGSEGEKKTGRQEKSCQVQLIMATYSCNPSSGRLGQGNHKFKASLGCKVRRCRKRKEGRGRSEGRREENGGWGWDNMCSSGSREFGDEMKE